MSRVRPLIDGGMDSPRPIYTRANRILVEDKFQAFSSSRRYLLNIFPFLYQRFPFRAPLLHITFI